MGEIAGMLLEIERVLVARGAPAVFFVTIGRGRHDLEEERKRCNALILQRGAMAVDCDALLETLGQDVWANHDHLTSAGYTALGNRVSAVLCDRLCLTRDECSKSGVL